MTAFTVVAQTLPALSQARRPERMATQGRLSGSRAFRRASVFTTSLSMLASVLLCGITAATNAQAADYYVATTANAGNETSTATAQYNYETLGGGTFTSQGAFGSQFLTGNCGPGCTAGTVSANPLLTSSFDQSSVPPNVDNWSASASANASLAGGAIGASATGVGQQFGDAFGVGQATAFLQDVLTFHNNDPLATASTIWQVGVNFTVNGTLSATPPAGDATVRAIDTFGNAAIDTTVQNTQPNYTSAVQNFSQSGWASVTLLSDTDPDAIAFSGEYTVEGLDPTVGISMQIAVDCAGGATCDYADTNAVTLTLPQDVTFMSQSGAFLSNASSVPEPGSLTVFALGLALLGLTRCGGLRRLIGAAACSAGLV